MEKLKIVSRNSPLAIAQSELVKGLICELFPGIVVDIIGVTTLGDKAIDKAGGKGLFTKELQQKLLNAEADLAVHSLKDIPTNSFSEFIIPAVLKRLYPEDCFISGKYKSLSEVPKNGVIGTSSSRRALLIKHYYPHVEVKPLRGNVQTRLEKLDSGAYDGIILALAGIKRLNLESRVCEILSTDRFIPAIGQGAIALEILSSRLDLMILLANLDDNDTFISTESEREVGRLLGADCGMPIGGYAEIIDHDILKLSVMVANSENKHTVVTCCDSKYNYINLAKTVVNKLKNEGVYAGQSIKVMV